MLLLLIRHADAGERDPARWADDAQRPITDEGRAVQAKVAKRLRKRRATPERILSSPWTRAWQSAQVTAEGTRGGAIEPVVCEALARAPNLKRLADAVGQPAHDAIVALVGHEPWLGQLASLLLTAEADRLHIDFPKSAVMGIEISEIGSGAGTLRFFWTPRNKVR